MWRVPYQPGVLKAVSRKEGITVMEKTVRTAGKQAMIELKADRGTLNAEDHDLSFVTVKITDRDGNMVPDADNLIQFNVSGCGFLAGTDNGYQASHESFKSPHRKAFNGLCLAIIQSDGRPGKIRVEATAEGLETGSLILHAK